MLKGRGKGLYLPQASSGGWYWRSGREQKTSAGLETAPAEWPPGQPETRRCWTASAGRWSGWTRCKCPGCWWREKYEQQKWTFYKQQVNILMFNSCRPRAIFNSAVFRPRAKADFKMPRRWEKFDSHEKYQLHGRFSPQQLAEGVDKQVKGEQAELNQYHKRVVAGVELLPPEGRVPRCIVVPLWIQGCRETFTCVQQV